MATGVYPLFFAATEIRGIVASKLSERALKVYGYRIRQGIEQISVVAAFSHHPHPT